jgi:hypothetical protein
MAVSQDIIHKIINTKIAFWQVDLHFLIRIMTRYGTPENQMRSSQMRACLGSAQKQPEGLPEMQKEN